MTRIPEAAADYPALFDKDTILGANMFVVQQAAKEASKHGMRWSVLRKGGQTVHCPTNVISIIAPEIEGWSEILTILPPYHYVYRAYLREVAAQGTPADPARLREIAGL